MDRKLQLENKSEKKTEFSDERFHRNASITSNIGISSSDSEMMIGERSTLETKLTIDVVVKPIEMINVTVQNILKC